jgi:hypothetical protein
MSQAAKVELSWGRPLPLGGMDRALNPKPHGAEAKFSGRPGGLLLAQWTFGTMRSTPALSPRPFRCFEEPIWNRNYVHVNLKGELWPAVLAAHGQSPQFQCNHEKRTRRCQHHETR